jgi:hypothetical protein
MRAGGDGWITEVLLRIGSDALISGRIALHRSTAMGAGFGTEARAPLPGTMSEVIVFDTSILIDQLRTDQHIQCIAGLSRVVRNCPVVLAELWRRASSAIDRKILEALGRSHPILTPTEKNWLECGGDTFQDAGGSGL